jgi:hypothetical protein
MPNRVAITVAGAVSLGSYEAGVLFEIVDAIAQHNQDPRTPAGSKIFIDVITGASAGGMSATVLAQKLLYEAKSLSDPYDNTLYRAWVEDVQLQALLDLQHDEDPTHSIFSSDLIEALSRKYLMQRYASHIPPPPDPHRASANSIRLGLALSNLNGVDYTLAVRPGGGFTYTQFQDQLHATATPDCDTADFWDPLRNAAISCGAFPFAFRVKDLVRHRSEYPSPDVVFPAEFETFTYTDGGVFQNEPLGMAKDLVDEVDKHLDTESRFYLFIAPQTKGSTAHSDFNAGQADFKATAVQLLNAIYGEAEFQDWIQAEKVNRRVDLFNRRAWQLRDALVGRKIEPTALASTANTLLPLEFADDPASMADAQARLKKQFQTEYNDLRNRTNAATADIWIDSILSFETAADLGQRDEMTIYGITAGAQELAGAQLMAFLGFFEQAYRDHDYDVGRTKAQKFLASPLLGQAGNLPKLNFTPKAIRDIDHSLDGLAIKDVPRDLRQTIKNRLHDRSNDLLEEASVSWIVREAIDLAFVDPQLDKLLDL